MFKYNRDEKGEAINTILMIAGMALLMVIVTSSIGAAVARQDEQREKQTIQEEQRQEKQIIPEEAEEDPRFRP